MIGIGSVAELATGLIDRFFPAEASAEQKIQASQALAASITARDQAKSEIIVAEMNQKDLFTKRARPMIVYSGLVMIFINHVLFPMLMRLLGMWYYLEQEAVTSMPDALISLLQPINLPEQFWYTWGGVCSIWVMGRSAEKAKASGNIGKLAALITGNK